MTSRRWIVAAAAFLAAPVLAGCAAGFDANTAKPYMPNDAAVLVDNGAYGSRGLHIPQAFVLGPVPGATIAQGEKASVYLNMVSSTGDTLQAVTSDLGTAKLVAPINLEPGKPVDLTKSVTPQVVLESLTKAVRGGEGLQLTLQFAKAGTVTMNAPVMTRSREYASLAHPSSLTATDATPSAPAPTPTPSASASTTAH
ncbi:copper chaperone PCu(A)C [Nonomuraea sp. NBC_01738]|uniref:copper chaperone PCu(A)C n=1 Tax=Nonomuraea sp. NBC_01738 TaxID=2976003 RepID=UPI002E131502|nr:copper chaperone PCu(A)C [Nonomuraea sp. NBC_01738]